MIEANAVTTGSPNRRYIPWDEVDRFAHQLRQRFEGKRVDIYTNWRGGAPLGIYLNNIMPDSTLSLLKYQTRDGEDDNVLCLWDDVDPDRVGDVALFVDDIFATGKSSRECISYIEGLWDWDSVVPYYLISRDCKQPALLYTDKTDEEQWMIFSWES